jgi:hypothetical protein
MPLEKYAGGIHQGSAGSQQEFEERINRGSTAHLVETYQMPDGRGGTPENVRARAASRGYEGRLMGSADRTPRIYVEVVAPPGLAIEAKRKLVRKP